jgi:hypothetical protein
MFTVRPLFGAASGIASVASNAVTPSVPSVYPSSGTVVEGNSGTRILNVPVWLSKASTQSVTVQYSTATFPPGFVASAPDDYEAATGTLTFAPGETMKNIGVVVKGDTVPEPGGERFLVFVSNPTNAKVGGYGGVGYGQIVNDD